MHLKPLNFAKHSSIKIGQIVDVLMIDLNDEIPTNRYLIGGANNLLLSTNPPQLMMLSKDFATIEQEGDMLVIGSAMPTGRIVSYMRKHDIAGFEFCAKLPGTLGGMLAMNAGVKSYEIFNILHSICINGQWILKEDIAHGYRFARLNGVATHAKFQIIKGFSQDLLEELLALRSNQPLDPSAGSAFKNPQGDYAGRLIEAVGLKGFVKGGMAWSEVHSNFLVNFGGGTYEEAQFLIDLAKEKVLAKFGIEMQEEIKIL